MTRRRTTLDQEIFNQPMTRRKRKSSSSRKSIMIHTNCSSVLLLFSNFSITWRRMKSLSKCLIKKLIDQLVVKGLRARAFAPVSDKWGTNLLSRNELLLLLFINRMNKSFFFSPATEEAVQEDSIKKLFQASVFNSLQFEVRRAILKEFTSKTLG